jgi:hypothetical protein
MFSSPLKIAFIGGCHILGYPLGTENSFVTIFRKILENASFDTLTPVYPYSSFKKVSKAVQICNESRPDILVLQLSNDLFNPILFSSLRKKLKQKAKRKSTSQDRDASVDVNALFVPSRKYTIRQRLKEILHRVIFFRALNQQKCREQMDAYFTALKKLGIENVWVMNGFPAADKVINKYRQIGNKLLFQKCVEYGYTYFDVFDVIEKKFGEKTFTIDYMHFSKEAHFALGQALAEKMKNTLPIQFELQSIALNDHEH